MTEIADLIARTDLLVVLGAYTDLRRVASTDGGEFAGPCPWCGGDDRFRVWPHSEHPHWWCRGCERRGDALDLVKELEHLSTREAIARLGGEPAGRGAPPASRPTPRVSTSVDNAPPSDWSERALVLVERCEDRLWSEERERARAYLRGRGLEDETIRAARLGLAGNETIAGHHVERGITIPWFLDGRVVNVNVRRPHGSPKYRAIAAGRKSLYMPAPLDLQTVVVVEGEFDALLLHQEAGDLACVAALGGKALQAPARPLLLGVSRILLALDADEPGQQAAAAVTMRIPRAVPLSMPGGHHDLTDAHVAGISLRAWLTSVLNPPTCSREHCVAGLAAYGAAGHPLCATHHAEEEHAIASSHLIESAIAEHGGVLIGAN